MYVCISISAARTGRPPWVGLRVSFACGSVGLAGTVAGLPSSGVSLGVSCARLG